MLDAHPELAIPPETHFVPDADQGARQIRKQRPQADGRRADRRSLIDNRPWADFGLDDELLRERMAERRGRHQTPGAALRAFFELYAERQGKPRWGDKTPAYMLSIQRIGRTLPEARFIHLIRDGRDVALSQRRWRERAGAGTARSRPGRRSGSAIRKSASRADRGREHYVEARYEDLVSDPEPTLRRICDALELEFEPAMLNYHERAAERLQEMAGALPRRGGQGRPRGRLPHGQARADAEAARPRRSSTSGGARCAPEDLAAFEAGPATCSRSSATRWETTLVRVGIVTKWFNRGQAFVSRYVRDALDELGHETFILARPTKDKGRWPAHCRPTTSGTSPASPRRSD